MFIGRVGVIKREGEFGNLGVAPVWGSISCSESRCLVYSRKLSVFLVFPFFPHIPRVWMLSTKTPRSSEEKIKQASCFKYVHNVISVVSVSLINGI